jgi:hypothetical protein
MPSQRSPENVGRESRRSLVARGGYRGIDVLGATARARLIGVGISVLFANIGSSIIPPVDHCDRKAIYSR